MSVTSVLRRHFVPALLFPALLLTTFSSLATIAIPTDLRTMVRKADLVFTGKVVAQRAEWANLANRKSIVTIVSFEVLDVHKGTAGKKLDLRCPGGTIGETTLELVGMPSFANDERCILFVRTNANAVCPIVGIYHGKLLLQKTGIEETISHHDGRPVTNISEIGKDKEGSILESARAQASPHHVTLSDLKARLREEVAIAPTREAK